MQMFYWKLELFQSLVKIIAKTEQVNWIKLTIWHISCLNLNMDTQRYYFIYSCVASGEDLYKWSIRLVAGMGKQANNGHSLIDIIHSLSASHPPTHPHPTSAPCHSVKAWQIVTTVVYWSMAWFRYCQAQSPNLDSQLLDLKNLALFDNMITITPTTYPPSITLNSFSTWLSMFAWRFVWSNKMSTDVRCPEDPIRDQDKTQGFRVELQVSGGEG